MREIDNNRINNMNFTSIQKADKITPLVPEVAESSTPTMEIKDLGSLPNAQLGKSQISSDSIETDMAILLKNPQQVEQLNTIFDKFEETHTYEEATQLLEAYKNEFVSKK